MRVYRKQALPSQGRDKVRVQTTLLRPKWDYTRYVIVVLRQFLELKIPLTPTKKANLYKVSTPSVLIYVM